MVRRKSVKYIESYYDALTGHDDGEGGGRGERSDGRRLEDSELVIGAECMGDDCRHLVTISPAEGPEIVPSVQSGTRVMTALEIVRLLYDHGMDMRDEERQHVMWNHVSLRARSVQTAAPQARRYRKSSTAAKAKAKEAAATALTAAVVDKKFQAYRMRIATVLRDQIKSLIVTLTSRVLDPTEEARIRLRLTQRRADLEDAESLIADDARRLILKSKASQEARLEKRQKRAIAGVTAAAPQANRTNRNKFRAHNNATNRPYALTRQNTVSKQNLPNANMPIENTRWVFYTNYSPKTFPAPHVAMHAPRATITHSASCEVGCTGARSTEASTFVAQEYAAGVALFTGTEMQIANNGEVNAAASSDAHVMTDLPTYNRYSQWIDTMIATHQNTRIESQTNQEKTDASAQRKGIASNQYMTGHRCTVGILHGQAEEDFYATTWMAVEDHMVQLSRVDVAEAKALLEQKAKQKLTAKRKAPDDVAAAVAGADTAAQSTVADSGPAKVRKTSGTAGASLAPLAPVEKRRPRPINL